MKKMLFVFNPYAGKARIKYVLLDILQIFSKAGYELTVYPTKAQRDGYNYIVNNGADYDILTCSGGDGTLNEVVDAVLTMEEERRPVIGYIPAGSTNDFAATLGLPKNDMRAAARIVVKNKPYPCDIGRFNGQTFNYVAAFGVFADVSYETPQELKNRLGHPAYIIEAMKRVQDIKPVHMSITVDGCRAEGDFIFGMITNARSVGGIKNIVGNDVGLNDGVFEMTFIRYPKKAIDIPQLLNGLMTQSIQDKTQVFSCKCSSAQIESERAVAWSLDGENGGEHEVMIVEVLPSAVSIIAPSCN